MEYMKYIILSFSFLLIKLNNAKIEFYGDLRGRPSNISVVKVGKHTTSNINQAVDMVNQRSCNNIPQTIIARDNSGKFSTTMISLTDSPQSQQDVVTKGYLDQAIQNIINLIYNVNVNTATANNLILLNTLCNQSSQIVTPVNNNSVTVNPNTSILILTNNTNINGYTIYFPANPNDGQFFTILLGTSNSINNIINTTTDESKIINGVTSLSPTNIAYTDSGASVTYYYNLASKSWYRFNRG